MKLPYAEPRTSIAPSPPVLPEPRRPGEPGGDPCYLCNQDEGIWSDDHWVLHIAGSSIPGTAWLSSRDHFDSFADMPDHLAAEYGRLAGRIEKAILGAGDFGRVHVYRWGDGNAHFHIWFYPRPIGMMDAVKYALPLWEDAMEPAPQAAIDEAAKKITEALG